MMTSYEILCFISARIGEAVHIDDSIKTLGIDSLDYIDLIAGLEDFCSRDVPKEKFADFDTVRSLVEYFMS